MNLNEKQKVKIREAYNNLAPEDQKNLKKAFNELNDEELSQVSGGGFPGNALGRMQNMFEPFVNLLDEISDGIVGFFESDVSGPKVNLEKCQFCGLPIPPTGMRDHLLNAHKEELAEMIKQSGIF